MKHNSEDHEQIRENYSEEKSLEERVELLEENLNKISRILVEMCRIQSRSNDPTSGGQLLRLQVDASNVEVPQLKR